jgi:phosphoglycerate dehydrogenase-like enzyme
MNERSKEPWVILMSEAAYQRVASRLDAVAGDADVVLMRPDRALAHARDGRSVTAGQAQTRVAWAGSETFIEGLFPALAEAAMESSALAWFQSGSAGSDDPLFARLIGQGARLTTCRAPAEAVADYVMAGALDHLQRGPERRTARSRKEWTPLPFTEIGGQNWLILGFGAIGQCVARRARAFGADITGVRRSGGSHELAHRVTSPASLATLLPSADVVVLALPLAADTERMVDADFVSRMKPGSLLINVSRGKVVDEAALLRGLDANRPGHAILDVFAVEPLPADHPIWVHERITLTAHVAGMGSRLVARSDELFLTNLRRFCDGDVLLHEVRA